METEQRIPWDSEPRRFPEGKPPVSSKKQTARMVAYTLSKKYEHIRDHGGQNLTATKTVYRLKYGEDQGQGLPMERTETFGMSSQSKLYRVANLKVGITGGNSEYMPCTPRKVTL